MRFYSTTPFSLFCHHPHPPSLDFPQFLLFFSLNCRHLIILLQFQVPFFSLFNIYIFYATKTPFLSRARLIAFYFGLIVVLVLTENGWWGFEFVGERRCETRKWRKKGKVVEEGQVPACGISLIAWLFERQRVYSRSLSIWMAHEADFVEHIHHPQWNS